MISQEYFVSNGIEASTHVSLLSRPVIRIKTHPIQVKRTLVLFSTAIAQMADPSFPVGRRTWYFGPFLKTRLSDAVSLFIVDHLRIRKAILEIGTTWSILTRASEMTHEERGHQDEVVA